MILEQVYTTICFLTGQTNKAANRLGARYLQNDDHYAMGHYRERLDLSLDWLQMHFNRRGFADHQVRWMVVE